MSVRDIFSHQAILSRKAWAIPAGLGLAALLPGQQALAAASVNKVRGHQHPGGVTLVDTGSSQGLLPRQQGSQTQAGRYGPCLPA